MFAATDRSRAPGREGLREGREQMIAYGEVKAGYRTMIDDLVSSFGQLANEVLLKLKGRMVGADMNM